MMRPRVDKPEELDAEYWSAIVDNFDRLDRAVETDDWPAAVGTAKDLCESVARVVLAARSEQPSPRDFGKTINAAHAALKLKGAHNYGDRPVLEMANAARKLATPLAELRNDLGTGHGRAAAPAATIEHASIAVDGAVTWTRWAIRRLDIVLRNSVDRLIADLDGGEVFTAGLLAERLHVAELAEVGEPDLLRLGRAISHRGAHGGTLVIAADGIDTVARSPDEFPAALRRGLIQGLLVDAKGYVRARPEYMQTAISLAESLDDSDFMEEFSVAVDGADFSYATSLDAMLQMLPVLQALIDSMRDGRLRNAWIRVRQKFESGTRSALVDSSEPDVDSHELE